MAKLGLVLPPNWTSSPTSGIVSTRGGSLSIDNDEEGGFGNLFVKYVYSSDAADSDLEFRNAAAAPFDNNGVRFRTKRLGFFNAATVEKPTGVAVTAEGIHAALVLLGLIGP